MQTENESKKFCVNCKHFIKYTKECKATEWSHASIVTGEKTTGYYSCYWERDNRIGACKEQALKFEPQPKRFSLWQSIKKMFKKV